MINLNDVLEAYKTLETNGLWLTDEQKEYAGVGYRLNYPLRYTREGNIVALECHESDLEEITETFGIAKDAYLAIKQGKHVFAVFMNNERVNYLVNVMEDYLNEDED